MIVTYQAINAAGNIVSDSLTVDDLAHAHEHLRNEGLTPVRVAARRDSTNKQNNLFDNIRKKLAGHGQPDPQHASPKELAFFTEQMAILLETGTPVAPSLQAMARQVNCPHWAALINRLYQHVEEGGSLASAAEAFPRVFDPIYASMIAAGEASGNLPTVLSRLGQIQRQSDRIKRKVLAACIYPALLTTMAMAVTGVLVFIVLPRFAQVFTDMNVDLPSTKFILNISGLVRQHFLLAPLLTASVIAAIVYALRTNAGRRFRARNSLRLPIFGPLIKAIHNARVFRLIGFLIESSVPLLEALRLTQKASTNYLYINLLQSMHESVLNGRSMHEILLESPLIPASLAQIVHTGEDNAQVGRVMTTLADHLDDHNETQINMLTSIMEPVILIFMGLILGTVAISLVLPMFDLSRISA